MCDSNEQCSNIVFDLTLLISTKPHPRKAQLHVPSPEAGCNKCGKYNLVNQAWYKNIAKSRVENTFLRQAIAESLQALTGWAGGYWQKQYCPHVRNTAYSRCIQA